MKKLLAVLLCLTFASFLTVGVIGCGDKKDADKKEKDKKEKTDKPAA